MIKKNPNSSIRSGYKYEDLHVLNLCVEWLTVPEKFKGIKIQYVPDGTKGFALDDVVLEYPDGRRSFFQLKHKQNPTIDLWNFNHLIEKGLLKWIASYGMLGSNTEDSCSLVTNGLPADDVQLCLVGAKLDLIKIGQNYPEVEQKLRLKFSDNDQLEQFFNNFSFTFNHPGKDELDEKLRKSLYEDLKVTKAGVDSLLIYIGTQGSEKYPKDITLNLIRSHLSWDNPRPLNQSFQVPSDFEFFDKHSHHQILSDLKRREGGTKIIIGKPGAGKSTYLSKLFDILQRDNVSVFRHHYHLNPKDNSQFERLNADRVKEALRASFKNEKSKVLEELSWENTGQTPLREFISKIAAYYGKQGKAFVLIIDGLDHVIREGNSEIQLQEFLNDIFYPQEGYWLLLGTQEMAVKSLPNSIIKFCPESNWIEIKGLSRINASKIIRTTLKNRNKNHIEIIDNGFINEIYDKTTGNPLHLRYILSELCDSEDHISSYFLNKIPAYKGDIKNYYEEIWRGLSDLAKTFCFAITTLDFKLHKEQLTQLGGYFTRFPTDITSSFKDIKHLLFSDLSGISVYHNSFMVFILDQPELNEQRILLYQSIRSWLYEYNDENLKWSELAKIEYYLGNSSLLLNLDKEWLINSYLQCKEEDQIQNLLELAKEAAFNIKDFKKVIFFGEISAKFEMRSYNLWDENLHKIWVTSFRNNPDIIIKYPDFSKLPYYQVTELLIALKYQGKINEIPEAAYDRINILFKDRNIETSSIAKAWLEVLLNFEEVDDNQIIKFLKQFRAGGSSQNYFAHYVNKILENRNQFEARLSAVFKVKLNDQEKASISHVLVNHDLRNGKFDWKHKLATFPKHDSYVTRVYNYLCIQDLSFEMTLKSRSDFPDKYHYGSEGVDSKKLWFDQFFNALFLTLSNNSEPIQEWLKLDSCDKQTILLQAVLEIAQKLANCFLDKKHVVIIDVLKTLEVVPEFDYYKDHSLYELRRTVVPKIIDYVVWITNIFNIHLNFNHEIQVAEIKKLSTHPWYYQSHLFNLLHEKKAKLSTEAFLFFVKQELDELRDELTMFKDKAERMVNLAILAADLNLIENLNLLLYKAAENLIAYGNHKDMLLNDILLGIDNLITAESKISKELLRKFAPYVYKIDKLTDGDETGSFIYDYCTQLASVDTTTLYNFYFLSIKNRDYYLSESIFSNILTTLDFSKPLSKAIGATAIGDAPYGELGRLALGDEFAMEVLKDIHKSLGEIEYGREIDKEKTIYNNFNKEGDNSKFKIVPQNLEAHLQKIDNAGISNRYEKSSFLLNWTKTWLESSRADKRQIIGSVKIIIEKNFVDTEHELLDYLYPFAINIDREFAFQCICWAQSNCGSWSSDYFSNAEVARTRWNKVIFDFPSRLEEFFNVSVNNSGLKYSRNKRKNYSIAAPRLIQFFIDSGQTKKAEDIAGFYIYLLPTLFPNVNLPEPEFYQRDESIGLFDILLKRLEWMSPIVKERAAKQLVNLLMNDKGGAYHEKFFIWLKLQMLESRACEGLIILLLSVENDNSYSKKYITSKNIGGLLSIRCMATDLIMMAIGSYLNLNFKFKEIAYISMSFGSVSHTKVEFEQLIGRNLPLIYINYMNELQDYCPFQVWECWSTLFDDYCSDLELVYQREDEAYNNDFNSIMVGRATIFTEILRSTFFRLLDFLHNKGFLSIQDLFSYTISNFTIEPSIWKVELGLKPTWWPKTFISPKLKYNESPPDFELDLVELLTISGECQLLSFNTVFPHTNNFYHSDYYYEYEILPFACADSLNCKLSPRDIFQELKRNSGIWYPDVNIMMNFGVYSNELKFIESTRTQAIKQYGIIPLIAPVRSMNTNMLQYYRAFYATRLLTPIIKQSLEFKIDKGCLQYYNKNKVNIGCYEDFLDGLRDTSELGGIIPYSSYLSINKSYLQDFLNSKKLYIAFVVKKTLHSKDRDGRSNSFTKTDSYQLINLQV